MVRVDRLPPRAPLTPFTDNVNLTAGDRDSYAGLGKAQRSKGFENVDVTFDAPVVLAAGLDQQRAQPGQGQPGHLPAGPHPELIAQGPLGFQAHGLLATLLITLWPFTRLVHVFSARSATWRAYTVYPSREPRLGARAEAAAGNASAAVSRR